MHSSAPKAQASGASRKPTPCSKSSAIISISIMKIEENMHSSAPKAQAAGASRKPTPCSKSSAIISISIMKIEENMHSSAPKAQAAGETFISTTMQINMFSLDVDF
ncbi:hypothetical protein [Ureibacillus sp. FSL W8-0352]|uniref:hypothetical protein n=1 Tax=Ureibacillus sp. FSL W8-0352 TaxID=2954596 RepID=UPI0030F66658